jgi:hypothetical protein
MPISNMDVLRVLTQLPGLVPAEMKVARAWLEEHHLEYDSVEFNVRLGTGVLLPPGAPEYMQRFATASTTKRADMVLHLGRDVTIVEVKVRIGGGAFGQLTLYKRLYISDHPEVQNVHLIAAGVTIEPDVSELFSDHAITVELFPYAWAPPPPPR